MPFLGPKWSISPEQNFWGTNHYYCFHVPIGPFHCANLFLKKSYSGSRVRRMHHFVAENEPFALNKTFLGINYYHLSSY